MAKNTISQRSVTLFDILDAGAYPALGDMKAFLWDCHTWAKSIDNGLLSIDADAEVSALKAQITELESMHKTELAELQAVQRSQLDELQSEKTYMETLCEGFSAEINRLRTNKEDDEFENLPPEQHEILVWMKQYDSIGGIDYRVVGVSRIVATYSLEVLCARKYIKEGPPQYGNPSYSMDTKGRAYLAKRGLLN